jgi:hypothetical protein
MIVRVKSVFNDTENKGKPRKIGEEFEVSKERYEKIKKFVEITSTKKEKKEDKVGD